jgi:ATP synthase F1 gamma subunit
MITKQSINEDLDNLSGLKTMIETYEEIAASRIKKTRDSVLKSRFFVEDLNLVFSEVKMSYKREIEAIMKRKRIKNPKELSFFLKNGKTLYLFISANTGLYGELIGDTFNLFLEQIKKENADIAIIGKLGLNLFLNTKPNKSYRYFDFPDSGIDDILLKNIVNFIITYEKVVVFFGKFQTIVTQKPEMTDISGNIEESVEASPSSKYFFEPSIEKILSFFEQEIFASIFEQTVKESQLAKFAARIVTLDQSTENIKKKLNQTIYQKNKLTHDEGNKKQLQTFSSMQLWQK